MRHTLTHGSWSLVPDPSIGLPVPRFPKKSSEWFLKGAAIYISHHPMDRPFFSKISEMHWKKYIFLAGKGERIYRAKHYTSHCDSEEGLGEHQKGPMRVQSISRCDRSIVGEKDRGQYLDDLYDPSATERDRINTNTISAGLFLITKELNCNCHRQIPLSVPG